MRPIKHDPTKKPNAEAKADPAVAKQWLDEQEYLQRQAMMSGRVVPDRSYLAEAIMLGSGIGNALKVPLTSLLKKGMTKRDVILRQLAAALGLDAVEQVVQESIPDEG